MAEQQNDGGPAPILPVKTGELLREVMSYGKENWRPVLKLAKIPILISFALELVLQALPLDTSLTGAFASLVPYAVFVIALHRRYLLELETSLAFKHREIRLLAYMTVFYLLLFLGLFILLVALKSSPFSQTVSIFVLVIILIPAIYIVFRLVLVFPMIAIDYPGKILGYIKFSWAAMRYSVAGVFCAEVVIYLAISSVFIGLKFIVPSALTSDSTITPAYVLSAAVGACSSFLIITCTVIVASYTFRKLVLSLPTPED